MSSMAPLHYAPRLAFSRRLRAGSAVTLATLLAGTVALVLWGRPAWNKVQLLYWQARCMSYTAPAERVIWEAGQRNRPPDPVAWARFYQLAMSSGLSSGGTVFLHERISPGGNRRLIAIDAYCDGTLLVGRVFVPTTLFSRPRDRTGLVRHVPLDSTAIYAGQPDRRDPSHFTIRYDVGGASHVLDGWLTDDDRVLLEARRPLASATASP